MKNVISALMIMLSPISHATQLSNDNAVLTWILDNNPDRYNATDYTGHVQMMIVNTGETSAVISCAGHVMGHDDEADFEHVNLHQCVLVKGSPIGHDIIVSASPGYAISEFASTATSPCSADVGDTEVKRLRPGDSTTIGLNVSNVINGTVLLDSDDIGQGGTLDLGNRGEVSVDPADGITVSGKEWQVTSGTPQITVTAGSTASGSYTSNLTATLTCK